MASSVVLFGAFERHNFGDLLMGVAFEHLLRQHGITVIHASILPNDLSSLGGRKVCSLFDLFEAGLDPDTPLLHVGGETAPASFLSALGADLPFPLPFRQKALVCETLRRQLRVDRGYPYLTPPVERINGKTAVWSNRLFYGIGFTARDFDIHEGPGLKEVFSDCKMVGFRDRSSQANASRIGIEGSVLTPDIVLSIGRLMPFPGRMKSGFLLLHFNQGYLKEHGREILDQLAELAGSFPDGIKIALAGVAPGHDSLDALYGFREAAAARCVPLEVLPALDVFSICKHIASAGLVVSTSLHYRIVARSYGIPRISMDVFKLSCWAASNDDLYPYAVDPSQLASAVAKVIDSGEIVDGRQERDLEAIDAYVAEIAEIIHAVELDSSFDPHGLGAPLPRQPGLDQWISSLSDCLDDKDEILRAQAIQLSSKRLLLKQLLVLLLPDFFFRSYLSLRQRLQSASSHLGLKSRLT